MALENWDSDTSELDSESGLLLSLCYLSEWGGTRTILKRNKTVLLVYYWEMGAVSNHKDHPVP